MELKFSDNLEELERIDKLRSKVLKFIMYKKRTEKEVRDKFKDEIDEDTLEDIIEYMKEQKYLDDYKYIERFMNEAMNIKNSSIKELTYKLITKGIDNNLIEDYICKNEENLVQFEVRSVMNIYLKKKNSMEEQDIKNYLYKKGYSKESIDEGIEKGKEE